MFLTGAICVCRKAEKSCFEWQIFFLYETKTCITTTTATTTATTTTTTTIKVIHARQCSTGFFKVFLGKAKVDNNNFGDVLLCYVAVWTDWWKPTFRIIALSPSSGLMLASTNQTTRRLNPKEHYQNLYRGENFKSHNINLFLFFSICQGLVHLEYSESEF
jgi:hypothetical protein